MLCSSHHALCPLGLCVGTHITIDAEGGGVFMNVLMSEHNGIQSREQEINIK